MTLHIHMSGRAEDILKAEAEARGISALALAKAILATAADRDLISGLIADVDVGEYSRRIKRGSGRYAKYMHDGRRMTINEIADAIGMNRHTFWGRLRDGWSFERAVATPVGKRNSNAT